MSCDVLQGSRTLGRMEARIFSGSFEILQEQHREACFANSSRMRS